MANKLYNAVVLQIALTTILLLVNFLVAMYCYRCTTHEITKKYEHNKIRKNKWHSTKGHLATGCWPHQKLNYLGNLLLILFT